MENDLLSLLIEATIALSIALLAVLLLRGVWLPLFGARNALLLWCIVPVSMLALLLPAPVEYVESTTPLVFDPVVQVQPFEQPGEPRAAAESAGAATIEGRMAPVDSISGISVPQAALFVWLLGLLVLAAALGWSQWRLSRSLAPLERLPNGSYRSALTRTGPALVGAIRPKIILPADFEQRYSAEQQQLIVAHERCHLRRGDAQFTLLACMIRCLFWFHPLVHLAWPRFRIDQELACDAAVLRAHPERRREYAEAMLATELTSPLVPVGCSWLAGHPLKQRVAMVYARPTGRVRLVLGMLLAIAAGSAAAIGAWSQQTPNRFYASAWKPKLELDVQLQEPSSRVPDWDRHIQIEATPLTVPSVSIEVPRRSSNADEASNSAATAEPTSPPVDDVVRTVSQDRASVTSEAVSMPGGENAMVEVQHARLIHGQRPDFPESRFHPRLISYPGMPESQRPQADWQPEGQLWVLLLRVALDEAGRPVDATVEDTNLEDGRLLGRYERRVLSAVQGWQFAPARIDGDAVRSHVLLPFYFDTRNNARPIDGGPVRPSTMRPISSSTLASRLAGR